MSNYFCVEAVENLHVHFSFYIENRAAAARISDPDENENTRSEVGAVQRVLRPPWLHAAQRRPLLYQVLCVGQLPVV